MLIYAIFALNKKSNDSPAPGYKIGYVVSGKEGATFRLW